MAEEEKVEEDNAAARKRRQKEEEAAGLNPQKVLKPSSHSLHPKTASSSVSFFEEDIFGPQWSASGAGAAEEILASFAERLHAG